MYAARPTQMFNYKFALHAVTSDQAQNRPIVLWDFAASGLKYRRLKNSEVSEEYLPFYYLEGNVNASKVF